MSYILDALERSEHERKQGELPSFRQDQALLYMRKERKSPWLMLLVVVLLLNAMVFLYIHFSGVTDERVSEAVRGLNHPVNAADGSAEKGLVEQSGITTEQVHSAETTMTSPIQRPAENAPQITSENAKNDAVVVPGQLREPTLIGELPILPTGNSALAEAKNMPERSERAPDPNPVVGSLEVVSSDLEQVTEQFELIEPKSKRLANSEPVTSAITEQSMVASKVVVAEEPLRIPDEAAQNLNREHFEPYSNVPYLEELDHRTRPKVSKLTFNSHIFSSTPSARRVMINNVYLREGQAFQGMTLLAIAEQYVVFEKDGQQFKIAAMRDWLG